MNFESLSCESWYNHLLKNGTKIKSSNSEYRILEHFGSSGNGEIFLGITLDHFLVGLKIILHENLIEKKQMTPNYVQSEVESLRNSTKKVDDIVLPFLDYFILQNDQDRYYVFVFKYFEGYIRLSDYFEKNLFHQEHKIKIKNVIQKHFDHIHSKLNIAHNDLQNNNILIHNKSLHVRLFDLGFCLYKYRSTEEQFSSFIQKDFLSIEKI
jgi:serine/threonine protein kinase